MSKCFLTVEALGKLCDKTKISSAACRADMERYKIMTNSATVNEHCESLPDRCHAASRADEQCHAGCLSVAYGTTQSVPLLKAYVHHLQVKRCILHMCSNLCSSNVQSLMIVQARSWPHLLIRHYQRADASSHCLLCVVQVSRWRWLPACEALQGCSWHDLSHHTMQFAQHQSLCFLTDDLLLSSMGAIDSYPFEIIVCTCNIASGTADMLKWDAYRTLNLLAESLE